MERKNKAARAVNIALSLIVILAVILASPVFGFGRGFASKEQRMAAANPVPSAVRADNTAPTGAAATPRPTAQPTPTPVVLPTAPPTPEPTPPPTPRPTARPMAVQQPIQQNAQQSWTPEEAWEGEDEYIETEAESAEESDSTYGGGEELGSAVENGMIETGNADLVIQNVETNQEVYIPPQQGSNESEGFIFE